MNRPKRTGAAKVDYKDPKINRKDRDGYARASDLTLLNCLVAVGNWPRDRVDLALRKHNNDKEMATEWLLEHDYRAQTGHHASTDNQSEDEEVEMETETETEEVESTESESVADSISTQVVVSGPTKQSIVGSTAGFKTDVEDGPPPLADFKGRVVQPTKQSLAIAGHAKQPTKTFISMETEEVESTESDERSCAMSVRTNEQLMKQPPPPPVAMLKTEDRMNMSSLSQPTEERRWILYEGKEDLRLGPSVGVPCLPSSTCLSSSTNVSTSTIDLDAIRKDVAIAVSSYNLLLFRFNYHQYYSLLLLFIIRFIMSYHDSAICMLINLSP